MPIDPTTVTAADVGRRVNFPYLMGLGTIVDRKCGEQYGSHAKLFMGSIHHVMVKFDCRSGRIPEILVTHLNNLEWADPIEPIVDF